MTAKHRQPMPPVVVMGVAGSGKSVVGSALAEALGVAFVEGDELHPPENVARMAAGQPLTDADRAGWLEAVGTALAKASRGGAGAVAACSALKRRYRDRLRGLNPQLVFLYLAVDAETARSRVAGRKGHFMPSSLVDSQFATLEPPAPDEAALQLDGSLPVAELVRMAADFLRSGGAGGAGETDRAADARRGKMSDGLYEILDPRFARLVNAHAQLERLYTGCLWAEGPAWFAAGRYLVWSDVPNDRMLRFDETDGSVSVFRQPSANSNGNTIDRQGRLVTCEHGNRRVSRTEHDGTVVTIADRWQGKRLNSPNDVVVKSDGSIWFTDPTYGIDSDYEGNKAESEIGASYVYRVDPASGAVEAVVTDMVKPNGLAFSPDETKLYVVDTGRTHGVDNPAHMRVFGVGEDGRLSGGDVFADCTAGLFDGFRLDEDGRIWTSAADGIHCYHPDGTLIGKIRVPEAVANCVFGGAKRNCLYIAATTSLYRIRLMVSGNKTY